MEEETQRELAELAKIYKIQEGKKYKMQKWNQEWIKMIGKDVGKREPLCTAVGKVDWISNYGK